MATQKKSEAELKHYAVQLRRSNNDLEQFAYVASHDLKEPLRMVTNYVALLAEEYKNKLDGEANEFIHHAVDGAMRMSALIDGLLAYSRAGNKGAAYSMVDFNEIFRVVTANLQSSIEESGASVTSGNLPTIMADRIQMMQLFQNLLGNALKFRGDKIPRIHVSAENVNEEWRFSVSDNGIGIEEKYRERIFIIFQRLHHRDKYPGTGIGLAICQKSVQQHRGRIWVDSKPGEGATFFFTLPLKMQILGEDTDGQDI